MEKFLIVLGIFGILCQEGYSNKYENHTLLQFNIENDDQLTAAVKFADPDGEAEVLKPSRALNDTLDVLVPPSKMQFMDDFANKNGIKYQVKHSNYGRKFEEAQVERTPRRRVLRNMNVYQYNSYAHISDFLDTMANKYPELVTLKTLGNSYEGRRMKALFISSNKHANNPTIMVDAGVHSREWVAPAMAVYMIHRLLTSRSARKAGGELDGVDWIILPIVNPDGYEYSRSSSSNRMWRQTRSKHGSCYGVDGNRNYGFEWGVSGVSHDPCNKETFAGPRPFSEPETVIVRDLMLANADRIKLYVSLHSYGQYLVYPWGYTGDSLPPTWKKLDNLARKVSETVKRAGGEPFKVLSAGKWYPAAGGSDDFAFGEVGIPYSYTMELTDNYEFLYPEHLLKTTLPKLYEGFRTFAANIRNEFQNDRKKRSDCE